MASSIHLLGKSANEAMTDESYRFKVLCSAIKAGNLMRFPAITTGEHFWIINCSPHKDVKGEIVKLSFDLRYLGEWKNIKVTVNSSVLKNNDVLSSMKFETTTTLIFGRCRFAYNFWEIKGDDLKKFLKDDYLIVICNLTILSAASAESSDFGVTIIQSLTGKSKHHSSDNKDIAPREMASGSFQFKIMSSDIKESDRKYFHSPMFMVGEVCWFMQCFKAKHGHLSFFFLVRSEIKDLKVSLDVSVYKNEEDTSDLKGRNITDTLKQCGEWIYFEKLVEGDELKQHLKDDYFIVALNITILSETVTSDHDVTIISSTGKPRPHSISGPSPYLHEHLSQLLQNKERTDTTFEINGELFQAHRLVLAARSKVFNAQLFNPMYNNYTKNIKVNGIEPRVFKAMLHFIYTDMLPNLNASSNVIKEENKQMDSIQMTRGLLVAADRYSLERLKLICQDKLSKSITINNVATTLILAEKHNCPSLKSRSLEFIVMSENFTEIALTKEYGQLLVSYPMILKDLGKKLQNMCT